VKLRDYLAVVRRRIGLIAVTLVVTVGIAIGLTAQMERKYTASAVLRLDTKAVSGGQIRSDSVTFVDTLKNTYATFARGDAVFGQAVRDVGGPKPKLAVESVPNTELLRVKITAGDAPRAASLANAVAERLVQQVHQLELGHARSTIDELSARIDALAGQIAADQHAYNGLKLNGRAGAATDAALARLRVSIALKQAELTKVLGQREPAELAAQQRANALSVVEPAEAPTHPSSPRPFLNGAIGLVLGIVGGLGLAFLLEGIRPTLNTTREIEEAASRFMRDEHRLVVGRIPRMPRRRVLGEDAGDPFQRLRLALFAAGREDPDGAFQRLRLALFAANGRSAIRSLLVTSSAQGDGKSSVVANLGLSLARSGRTVLLVDGDLRKPALHRLFDLSNDVGLTHILSGREIDPQIRPSAVAGLSILTAGPLPPNASALLESFDLRTLFDALGERFDVVIVDTPPVLGAEDTLMLAQAIDGVVLVVPSSRVLPDGLEGALSELGRLHVPLVGIVVNRVAKKRVYA
jgi:succinoglycan biosynthesis transport protein ExoP